MSKSSPTREQWSGNLGFVLAAAGSAIGLGNIWRFPYVTGMNGGGAFVLVYLLCILGIGIPVMLCEITLGRHTQRNPVGAFRRLTPRNSMSAHILGLGAVLAGLFLLLFQRWGWGLLCLAIGLGIFRYSWRMVGGMGVLAGFLILSFYSVVGGWTLGYGVEMLHAMVSAPAAAVFETPELSGAHFERLIASPLWSLSYHFLFMAMCIGVVVAGVRGGIERAARILMPLLLLLLLALIVRGVSLPGAARGVRFFLSPDFSRLSATSILSAMGLAFFSLSLGMGAIITYGSYVGKDQNLFTASLAIVGLDTLIALLAGLAIFPAVFAVGMTPDSGPGLVFVLLPTVLLGIPYGAFWGLMFFLLLLVAAFTSGISLLEVVTSYFVDERGWSRRRASVVFGAIIAALGALSALSPDAGLTGWRYLGGVRTIIAGCFGAAPGCFFDLVDNLASNWFLPLGGLFIALFVGWVWGPRQALEEIRQGSSNFGDVHIVSLLAGLKEDPSHNSPVHVLTLASLWGIFIRFISPVAILIAFLHTIGWLRFDKEPPPPAASPPPAVEVVEGAGEPGDAGPVPP